MRKFLIILAILVAVSAVVMISCYNKLQTLDENASAAASEIINQYKRRADLIPNLVSAVKGYTDHESTLLIELTEKRSQVGQLNISAADFNNPETIKQYQRIQGELGAQLNRLLVVTENYPNLESSELYRNLMAQLEGTENRIGVARGRYITAVREYNTALRKYPYILIADHFNYQPKIQFSVDDENISQAPIVSFN